MGYPQHPDTITIKNKFYPKGLREIDTYKYYQKMKSKLLKEVAGRDLMFYIATDVDKLVIRRSGKGTKYIRLTNANWDDEIHGRVVSIHSAMKKTDNIAIVDIDTDNFSKAKKAVADCYEVLLKRVPIVDRVQIRFTGKASFHLFCKLNRTMNVDSIRLLLKKVLSTSPELRNYAVEFKRTSGQVNLDLAPNKFRGNFITLHSLSTWGLKCVEVKLNKVSSFTPNMAKI